MRKAITASLLVVLVQAVTVCADSARNAATDPAEASKVAVQPEKRVLPARPVALTNDQYEALQQLQAAPEHQVALNTAATYSAREKHLEFTRFSDDFWTVVYDVGWPGTYLLLVLCAAPL